MVNAINTFIAFKSVIWDYFHIQYHTSFQKAKTRINTIYLYTYWHGLNITEKVKSQLRRLSWDCTIFCGALSQILR